MSRYYQDDERDKRNARREPPLTRPNADDFYIEPEDRQPRSRKAKPAPVTYEDEFEEPKRVNHHHYYEDEPPPKRKKPKKKFSFFRFFFKWSFIAACWGLVAVACVIGYFAAQMPPLQSLEVPKRPPNIQILYNDGSRMADRGEMGAPSIPLKDLPKHIPEALLAIEDKRFYSHFGFDLYALGRAFHANITRKTGPMQGGSTLTQQLAKNLFLTHERTFSRKVQEAILTVWLEIKFTKAQILEMYLNRVYYGAGAYGIEAASRRLYGKPATNISVKEAAIIAGLVQAPSRLNPTKHPEAADKRARLVLNAMLDQGKITKPQYDVALADPARVNRAVGNAASNYVADWIIDLLDDYIGKFTDDIVVQTTLNPALQAAAERIVRDELDKQGAKLNVSQAAVVVLGMGGEVLALIGGKNYNESQYNRAVIAKRQPGSAFKPFVYLTAVESGMKADTMREDAPFTIGKWSPENYTRQFIGPVTLGHSLAMSLNTVAVRLGQEMTPQKVIKTAQHMGINSQLNANASLALGTSEVTLQEITSAYLPFANGGLGTSPHPIKLIVTADKKKLYARSTFAPPRVIEPDHLAQMNVMLHEVVKSGTGKRANLPGWTIAGKTGTTQDNRDAWFIGYSGRYVTGVWTGNDDADDMKKVTGGGFPTDIWNRVMAEAHKGQRPVDLPGAWRQMPIDPPVLFAPSNENAPMQRREQLPREEGGLGGLFDKIFGR
jgi:penicillin-binding protein 1A